MEQWGNGRANEYYEANVPNTVIKPKEGDPVRTVERYIRDKYEMKKFVSRSAPPIKPAREPAENHLPERKPVTNAPTVRPQTLVEPVQQKVIATAAPAVNLIDFMDDPTPVSSNQLSEFGEFSSAIPVSANVTQQQAYTDPFVLPAVTQQVQQHQPQPQSFNYPPQYGNNGVNVPVQHVIFIHKNKKITLLLPLSNNNNFSIIKITNTNTTTTVNTTTGILLLLLILLQLLLLLLLLQLLPIPLLLLHLLLLLLLLHYYYYYYYYYY